MTAFLDAGANALEPDVMKFSDSAVFCVGCGYINDSAGPSGLFIYHDDVLVTTRMPLTVEAYLDGVRAMAASPTVACAATGTTSGSAR